MNFSRILEHSVVYGNIYTTVNNLRFMRHFLLDSKNKIPAESDGELRAQLLCDFPHASADRCLVRGCVGPPVTLSSPITDHEKSQFLAADKCYAHKQRDKNCGCHDVMNTSGGQRIILFNRLTLPVQRSNVMQSTPLSSRETLFKNFSKFDIREPADTLLLIYFWIINLTWKRR